MRKLNLVSSELFETNLVAVWLKLNEKLGTKIRTMFFDDPVLISELFVFC
jgi:hypothetical protein